MLCFHEPLSALKSDSVKTAAAKAVRIPAKVIDRGAFTG